MNLTEAEKFVESLRWQYAKSYPTAPHEYSVLRWNPENKDKFIDFANTIIEYGRDEKFYSKMFRVLDLGEYKYWTMDFPIENTDLINRTYNNDELKIKLTMFIKSANFKYEKGITLNDIRSQYEVHSKNG